MVRSSHAWKITHACCAERRCAALHKAVRGERQHTTGLRHAFELVIAVEYETGWKAAVSHHFQALVSALELILRASDLGTLDSSGAGGSPALGELPMIAAPGYLGWMECGDATAAMGLSCEDPEQR